MDVVLHEASFVNSEKSDGRESKIQNRRSKGNSYEDDSQLRKFSLTLPNRNPIDLQFENVTFDAKLGFRKGKIYSQN